MRSRPCDDKRLRSPDPHPVDSPNLRKKRKPATGLIEMKFSAPPAQIATEQIAMRFFRGIGEAPTGEQTEDKPDSHARQDGWNRVFSNVKLSFMKGGAGALLCG